MIKFKCLGLLLMIGTSVAAQRIHVGVFGGLAAYNGDLAEKIFPKKVTNGALGVTVNYELRDKWMLRGGLSYAVVGGADRFSDQADIRIRNLAFETSIVELSAIGEYTLFNLYDQKFSPYAFLGVAAFHFNPYAYYNGQKTFLKPLSTEGQGIAGYAGRQYGLTQIAIPFGGGVKYAINDNLRIGLELGVRKLFTDYLDDVSTNYADPNDLLQARGQRAVDMSYRGDEIAGGNVAYPNKGELRGSPKYKDWYYFTGIHLTYRINANGGRNNRLGCPRVPL